MSTTPATPTRWQRIRGHIKEARWPLVAFLATAVVLWWWLPARPDVVLPDGLEFLTYSRDGKALVTAQINQWKAVRGPTQLWDCASGRELRRCAEGEGDWTGVLPSPDGSRVATLGRSGLRIWDVAAGHLLAAPPGQWELVAVPNARYDPGIDWCFSPDGALLAYMAPSDRPDANPSGLLSLRIWDVARGSERAVIEDVELNRDSWTNWRIAFSPDGRTLAASARLSEPPARPGEASRRTPVVQLWDVAAGRERAVLRAYSAPDRGGGVSSITFSEDGRTLATGASGDYPSEVTLWDVATGQQRHKIRTDHYEFVASVQLTADGRFLLESRAADHSLYDLSVQPARKLRDLYPEYQGMYPAAFHPGRGLVAWSEVRMERGVALLKLDGMQEHELMDSRLSSFRPVAFAPDGRTLAVHVPYGIPWSPWARSFRWLRGENCIGLVDVDRRRTQAWLRNGADARFSPDGTTLATLGADGRIRLYHLPARASLAIVFGGAVVPALLALLLVRSGRLRRLVGPAVVPVLLASVPVAVALTLDWYAPGLWDSSPVPPLIVALLVLVTTLWWRVVRKRRRAATTRKDGPAGHPLGD